MSNEGTDAQHCLSYKEVKEIGATIQWVAKFHNKPVDSPKPVHFPYPSYDSAGDLSAARPSTPVISDHAHYLFKTYSRPARPGEFILLEMLYHNIARQFLQVIKRNRTHVTIEALDFVENPLSPDPRCIRVEKTYSIKDGYVDIGSDGIGGHLLLALWRLWHLVTTHGRRMMDTLKAPMVGIWYKFLDYYYGYKFRDEDRFMAELQSQTVN